MKVVCFDLDDTLFKEIDYLHAAYELISKKMFGEDWKRYYQQMLEWYDSKEDVFQNVCNITSGWNKDRLLDIYRYDVSVLTLSLEVESVLNNLKNQGARLGLITDGRSITQRNKIYALGLDKYVENEDIVISEEFGSEKPSLRNFEYFMKRYPIAEGFVYIGDNPKKDFIAPNKLHWESVCLLDDGRNIHKQEFEISEIDGCPQYKITELSELIDLI